MKRLFTIAALGAALLTGAAIAQSPQQDDRRVPIAQRSVKITAEQGYVIKENVLKGSGTTGQSAPSANVEVGDKAPANVELHDFPQLVLDKVPAVRTHKYFVMDNQVVIVSPSDNTIADIIK